MDNHMKRLVFNRLRAWKQSPLRKPLILKGVRQVGKTWLLKEFGHAEYEHVAYFNFEENPEYREFFAKSKVLGITFLIQSQPNKAIVFLPAK